MDYDDQRTNFVPTGLCLVSLTLDQRLSIEALGSKHWAQAKPIVQAQPQILAV